MNLFKISRKYLYFKPLSTGLNILLLSFGLAIITMLLLVRDQFETVVSKDAEGIDLVVGAKGSPLQLILSGVYHVDFPTGNIPIKEAVGLQRNRLVKAVLPMALGDNYKGNRIVGTNHDYLDFYEVQYQEGESWTEAFQVVVGAEVAAKEGLKVGDSFESSHGISEGSHSHDEHSLVVVGVLEPSGKVIDRLILTSIETVWYSHDEEGEDGQHNHDHGEVTLNGIPDGDESRELTTLLLQFRNPMAAVQLPRFINSRTSMQAASPTFEMARLFELLGVGIKLLQGLAFALIVIAGLGIFIALYNSLKERKYDLAVLRSIGATRFQLLQLILIEGITLTWIGALLGLALGHVFLFILLKSTDQGLAASIQAWTFLPEELWILLYATGVGLFASIIPAVTAYQTSIAKQLTKS
ncbi:ABC transporter permease [Algoriphagus sediminis]|uniref:ABC transporter permease n=1 Tax=Algoriphagus sediminis TaxID=3057113 RepID=A0ABT7YG89_9BACT|nr:FtsX-like permease family protein [Algoriphagus sediminis]MDN3205534.1 ABC transporter permease [Algoriphagus sediminis]